MYVKVPIEFLAEQIHGHGLIVQQSREANLPKFFLHPVLGGHRIPDPEGAEFQTLEDATVEALAAAHEITGDALRAGKGLVAVAFEIADEAGNILAMIPFNTVLGLG